MNLEVNDFDSGKKWVRNLRVKIDQRSRMHIIPSGGSFQSEIRITMKSMQEVYEAS